MIIIFIPERYRGRTFLRKLVFTSPIKTMPLPQKNGDLKKLLVLTFHMRYYLKIISPSKFPPIELLCQIDPQSGSYTINGGIWPALRIHLIKIRNNAYTSNGRNCIIVLKSFKIFRPGISPLQILKSVFKNVLDKRGWSKISRKWPLLIYGGCFCEFLDQPLLSCTIFKKHTLDIFT